MVVHVDVKTDTQTPVSGLAHSQAIQEFSYAQVYEELRQFRCMDAHHICETSQGRVDAIAAMEMATTEQAESLAALICDLVRFVVAPAIERANIMAEVANSAQKAGLHRLLDCLPIKPKDAVAVAEVLRAVYRQLAGKACDLPEECTRTYTHWLRRMGMKDEDDPQFSLVPPPQQVVANPQAECDPALAPTAPKVDPWVKLRSSAEKLIGFARDHAQASRKDRPRLAGLIERTTKTLNLTIRKLTVNPAHQDGTGIACKPPLSSQEVAELLDDMIRVMYRHLDEHPNVRDLEGALRAKFSTDTPVARQTKKPGRPQAANPDADRAIAHNWAIAKQNGGYKPEFAKAHNMTVRQLDRILDRVRARERRKRK